MEQEQQRGQRQLDLFPEFERQPLPAEQQRTFPGGRRQLRERGPLPVQAAGERPVAALPEGLHLAPSRYRVIMPRACSGVMLEKSRISQTQLLVYRVTIHLGLNLPLTLI